MQQFVGPIPEYCVERALPTGGGKGAGDESK